MITFAFMQRRSQDQREGKAAVIVSKGKNAPRLAKSKTGSRPGKRFLRGALLGTMLLATLGCKRLPESVPFTFELSGQYDPNALYRIKELAGAELRLDGRVLGKFQLGSLNSRLELSWAGSKAELPGIISGKYTIPISGACGDLEHPVEGPPLYVRSRSENEHAKALKIDNTLRIPLSVVEPKRQRIVVDWGSQRGTLRVGKTVVPQGTKRLDVIVEGCRTGPTVTLDGQPLGTPEFSEFPVLITTEPDVCHVIRDVDYGNAKSKNGPRRYDAHNVIALKEDPSFILENAPSSAKGYRGGLTMTELWRTNCR
jgi:hypothetical protein